MKVVVFLALFGLLFAKDIPSYVRRGHFEGRSGNVVIAPAEQKSTSGVLLLDHYRHTGKGDSIFDVSVANLISHLFQSPPPSNEKDVLSIDRSDFPVLSLFNAPAADVFIAFEDVDANVLQKYPTLSLLQNRKKLEVVSTYLSHDSLADIETLITGVPPSQHGIVGKSWMNTEGTEATAFSDSGSGSRADSLFDVLSLTSPESLIMSMSSDNGVAAAVGVRANSRTNSPNVLSYTWNSNHQTFVSVSGKSLPIKSTRAEILKALETNAAFQYEGITIQMDQKNMQAFVSARSTQVNSVSFDLNSEEDFRVFVELFFLHKAALSLSDAALLKYVKDDHPDAFAFAFEGVSAIRTKYGVESPQFSAALYVFDSAVASFIKEVQTLYHDKAATQIVFLPNKSALSEAVSEQVDEVIPSVGGFKQFLPEIYLGNELTSAEEVDLVSLLNSFLESHELQAYYFGRQDLHAQDMYLTVDHYYRQRRGGGPVVRVDPNSGLGTDFNWNVYKWFGFKFNWTGIDYTQKEVEMYQIEFWTSVFLIFIAYGGCCALCLLNPEKNCELLYRQTALGRETDTIPGGEYDFKPM